MAIDIGTIMSKVNSYAKTSDGKKRMDDTIRSYRMGGDSRVNATGKTYGGGSIVTEAEMASMARDMLAMLRRAAASADLPASVMEHIESFRFSTPFIEADGSATVQIYMTDSPGRPSLYTEKYSHGVENIVAIFNCGYDASGVVYGKWHGEKIVSKDHRDGKFFMQAAINEFNAKYGGEFDVVAELDAEYS